MVCRKPFQQGLVKFGCGQCLPCRIAKRRIWTVRLMLEYFEARIATYVTLTYNDKNLPADKSVDKKHLQDFFKYLRRKVGKVRYYACGEYGEEGQRPHYHAIIFGAWVSKKTCEEIWEKGFCRIGMVNEKVMAYVAGYVTKKVVWKDVKNYAEGQMPQGRTPEFQLMSRRPGIGNGAVKYLVQAAEELEKKGGSELAIIKIGGKEWHLGRYLLKAVEKKRGITDEQKERRTKEWTEELALELKEEIKNIRSGRKKAKQYEDERRQRVLNIESRFEIYNKRRRGE